MATRNEIVETSCISLTNPMPKKMQITEIFRCSIMREKEESEENQFGEEDVVVG